ncbi:MAG: glycosyltransferase family 92 protein, partial [Chlamydiia bacterium]|nr:glycosyltransferase family 92 protein [Chlamydiia bacterium]
NQLEKQMAYLDRKKSGIMKLNFAEKEFLSQWLQHHPEAFHTAVKTVSNYHHLKWAYTVRKRESAQKSVKHIPGQLAICGVIRNEAPFVREWIEYHKQLGVQYFYLYNQLSQDAYTHYLDPYLTSGEVILIEWPRDTSLTDWSKSCYGEVYADAVERAKGTFRWLACIDVHEFLVPTQDRDLLSLLKRFERDGGIAVNQQLFGTSGHRTLQRGYLFLEHFHRKLPEKAPLNHLVKYIVQPHRVEECFSGRSFLFTSNSPLRDPDGNTLPQALSVNPAVPIHSLRINSYPFHTAHHLGKYLLPTLSSGEADALIKVEHEANTTPDRTADRFIPTLKQRLRA